MLALESFRQEFHGLSDDLDIANHSVLRFRVFLELQVHATDVISIRWAAFEMPATMEKLYKWVG
jgi:hypothetical protein